MKVLVQLALTVPLLGAVLALLLEFFPENTKKRIFRYVFVVPLIELVLVLFALPQSLRNSSMGFSLSLWFGAPRVGIEFWLAPLSLIMVALASFVAFVSLLQEQEKPTPRFYALYLLMLFATTGMVLTNDVFNLFVFLEIALISSVALVATRGGREALEASIRYLLIGAVASAFMLLGIALFYRATGNLNFYFANEFLSGSPASSLLPYELTYLIFVLLLMGLMVESAQFPLFYWLFDAHPAAPATVSSYLSGILIGSASYALYRVSFLSWGFSSRHLILWIGLITFVVAEIGAVFQKDMKRTLAYSSAGAQGLFVASVASGAFGPAFVYLLNHALSKALLFAASGYMTEGSGSRIRGEVRGNIVQKVAFSAGALSLSGLPGTLGFVAKITLLASLVSVSPLLFYTVLALLPVEFLYWGVWIKSIKRDEGIVSSVKEILAYAFYVVPVILLGLVGLVLLVGSLPDLRPEFIRFFDDAMKGALPWLRGS